MSLVSSSILSMPYWKILSFFFALFKLCRYLCPEVGGFTAIGDKICSANATHKVSANTTILCPLIEEDNASCDKAKPLLQRMLAMAKGKVLGREACNKAFVEEATGLFIS